MPTSECHYQSCDRTFVIHQSLEERCTGQVPPLSGDECGAGPILFCHSDFEKSQCLGRSVDAQVILLRGLAAGVSREELCTHRGGLSR